MWTLALENISQETAPCGQSRAFELYWPSTMSRTGLQESARALDEPLRLSHDMGSVTESAFHAASEGMTRAPT